MQNVIQETKSLGIHGQNILIYIRMEGELKLSIRNNFMVCQLMGPYNKPANISTELHGAGAQRHRLDPSKK